MPVLFALSPSHFVSNVGADAGFAALIGLAILVLLYFAHARETSSLRDQLTTAMQRLEELERTISGGTAASAKQPPAGQASAVAPKPPMAASSDAGAGASSASAVPGSGPSRSPSGAPGSAAAVPGSGPSQSPSGAPGSASAGSPAGSAPPAPTGAAAPLARPASGKPVAGSSVAVPAKVAPLVARRGTASGGPVATALRGSRPVSTGVGKTPAPVTAAALGNGFATAPATSDEASSGASPFRNGVAGHTGARWLIPAVSLVALAIIAIALVLILTTGSSNHDTAGNARRVANIAAAPTGVVPSTVTFAVVNATNVNQLAHHVGDQLRAEGFNEGTLATATDLALTKTIVGYLPSHREDALAVAHTLRLPAAAVRPVGQSSLGLVCPSLPACAADVVVTAGSDVAHKR